MKRAIFGMIMAGVLAGCGNGVEAEEPKLSSAERLEICTNWHDMARDVMKYRQHGISLAEVLSLAGNEVYRELVLDAYDHPFYQLQDNKEREIREFANKEMLLCMDGY